MDILHASHNVTGTTQLPGDNLRELLHLTPTICSLWTGWGDAKASSTWEGEEKSHNGFPANLSQGAASSMIRTEHVLRPQLIFIRP